MLSTMQGHTKVRPCQNVAGLLTALVWTLLLLTVLGDGASANIRDLHMHSLPAYGVEHHQLLGQHGDWGILHIFAKCVRLPDNKVVFRGTGMFEQVIGSQYHRTPDAFIENTPEIFLEGPQNWTKHPLTVTFSQSMPNVPFLLTAEFTDDHQYFALKVEGYARWAFVRPLYPEEVLMPIGRAVAGAPMYTANVSAQTFDRRQAPVVGIISPMHINKDFHLEEFPALVAFHVRYHLRLGYTMFIMFLRPSLEQSMAENEAIRELVKQRRLKFIRWNELPQHKDHVYADQELLYNAANVLLWGHNVWYSSLDTDEYIAADKKFGHVQEVIFGCSNRSSDLIRLNRLQLDCPECRPSWQIGESGDILHWRKRETADPLKLYTRAGPFDMDDYRESKSFLNPNVGYALNPHRADLEDGAQPEFFVDPSCAYVAHLVNLVHIRRDGADDYYTRPTQWWWLQEQSELVY